MLMMSKNKFFVVVVYDILAVYASKSKHRNPPYLLNWSKHIPATAIPAMH